MAFVVHPALAETKVVFARNFTLQTVNEAAVVFNAPRPLLGASNPCTEWCHGRFYTEVVPDEPYAAAVIHKNNELDARLVLPVTDAEVVEMLLMDNDRAEAYREYPFQDQLDMLLPNIRKIQSLPYGEAIALLDAARAVLAGDAVFDGGSAKS